MRQIICIPKDRSYGFYNNKRDKKDFKAAESVSEEDIQEFNIPEKFLELKGKERNEKEIEELLRLRDLAKPSYEHAPQHVGHIGDASQIETVPPLFTREHDEYVEKRKLKKKREKISSIV